jgi:hypothetical protein
MYINTLDYLIAYGLAESSFEPKTPKKINLM